MSQDPLQMEAIRLKPPRRTRRRIVAACVAALAIAVLATGVAGVALWWKTGAFWPVPIPPRVQYLGEDYRCDGLPAADVLMRGLTLQGHTVGGGLIYARPPIGSSASEGWIVVTDGHQRQTCLYNGEG
ncbi:hypothetical protein [Leifsonia sp. 22587]|uniref:hypothetical protein n=1 Tax=Leifsonia sp. 22587 TaxID=3453946 RepID=UPI003F85EA83